METNFKLSSSRSIITYDLKDNNVSASDIVKNSDYLFTAIRFKENETYELPSTTIKANLDVVEAKKEFYRALKATGSQSKVTKLLICEIKDKSSYIFEDK